MIVLQAERERIETVRFTPDGRSLLTSSYGGTFLWDDPLTGTSRRALEGLGLIWCPRFTPDGRLLFSDRNAVTVTNLSDGQSRPLELWAGWRCGFDVTPDGRCLIVAQNDRYSPGWIACRPVEDLAPQAALWSHKLERSIREAVTGVAGGRFVLTESWWDQDLRRGVFRYSTRSAETGAVFAAVEGPEIADLPPAVSSDGELVAGLINARAVVFAASDFSRPVATLRNSGRKHFTGIAFHPSGRYLAATSNDSTVKLYDTATWELARTFTWDVGRMRSIAFSPDGTLAAAGSDSGKVVVWDVDL